MADNITQKAEALSLDGGARSTLKRVPFGKEMRKQFSFDPKWRNLNHGLEPMYITQVYSHTDQSQARSVHFPLWFDKSNENIKISVNLHQILLFATPIPKYWMNLEQRLQRF